MSPPRRPARARPRPPRAGRGARARCRARRPTSRSPSSAATASITSGSLAQPPTSVTSSPRGTPPAASIARRTLRAITACFALRRSPPQTSGASVRRKRLRRAAGEHAQAGERDRRRGLAEEACGSRPRGAARTASRRARRGGAWRAPPRRARRPSSPWQMRVTSSPAPAVTTARPSRCRSTVPPPMSITNGVVPARGVVPAPSTAASDSPHDDVRPAGRPLREHARAARSNRRARARPARARDGAAGAGAGPGPRAARAAGTRTRRAPARARRRLRAAPSRCPAAAARLVRRARAVVPSANRSRTVVSIASAADPATPASRTTSAVRRPATARAA